MGSAWDALNEQYRKKDEEQSLPSQEAVPAKSWAALNASMATARQASAPRATAQQQAESRVLADREAAAGVGPTRARAAQQTFISGATISAPAGSQNVPADQKTGIQGISFNKPSTGLPMVEVNNPHWGTNESTPWYEKVAAGAFNAVTGTFNGFVNTLGDLFDVSVASSSEKYKQAYEEEQAKGQPILNPYVADRVEQGKPMFPTTAEKAGAVINTAAAAAAIPFTKVGASLAAASEIPVVGLPFKTVNKLFEFADSASRTVAGAGLNALPIDEETKSTLMGPIQNLAGIIGTLGLMKVGHGIVETGGGRAVDALPVSDAAKVKIKGASQVTAATLMDPFTTAYRMISGSIQARTNAKMHTQGNVTQDDAKIIVNRTVKEVPIPEDTGTMRVPTADGNVDVVTNQRTVLQNLIRGQENINYRVVDTLGKDLQGNPIASRFEWDFKKNQATILVTDKATAVNLAHELGHYVDRQLGSALNTRLSDVLPDYRANRDQVNQLLADYALERLGGNATKPEIDAEILSIVDNLNQEIKVVAAGESRKAANEQFASAFAGVIDNPKMRELAPELSQLVDFAGAGKAKRSGTSEIMGEPGSMEEKGSMLTALEKTKRGALREVKNDPGFQEKVAYDEAKAAEVGRKGELISGNYKWESVVRAIKNSTEFRKEGTVTDATIDGTIMTRNGRDILVPRDKVKEYAAKGYTVRATMDEVAHASGFERAEDYVNYVTELSKDYREIDRSPMQKKAHEYLMANDPNYAKLNETIDQLREELVGEEAVVRAAQPRSAPEAGGVSGNAGQEGGPIGGREAGSVAGQESGRGGGQIGGTGLDTGKRVKDRLSYNPEKINAPEDVEALLKGVASASGEFKIQRISKGDEDIRALAYEVGVTPEQLMSVQAGSIANAETVFRSRQLIADMAAELRDTIRQKTTEGATEADLAEVKAKLLRLQGVMKTVAGFRTEASNVFRQFKLEARAGENDILKDLMAELKKVDAKAGDDLSAFVKGTREALQPTLIDKAWHLWYMSVLSGPNTQIKNFLGNAGNLGVELGRVALTSPSELPVAFQGLTDGFRKGFSAGMEILKNGDTSKFEAKGMEPIKFEGRASFLNYLDYVGRFMSAVDATFKEGFHGMELKSLAREQAIKEGYKGEALDRRVEELYSAPLEEMGKRATQFAERGTYTQKPVGVLGFISEAISSVSTPRRTDTSLKLVGRGTVRLIVPFTRIVANVVNVGLDWTPVGLVDAYRAHSEGGTVRQRNQAMSRAVLGTLAMAGFASMAAAGNLSGHGPKDSKRRDQLKATGWRPNSVKIGDKWVPYTSMGPLAIPMALVANLFDGYRYEDVKDEDWFTQATYAVMSSGNSLLDISFLSNLADFLSAVQDPERNPNYVKNFIAQQLTSPVPNAFKQMARWADPNQYETDTLGDQILYNLRITSGLKPALNVWGEQKKGEGVSGVEPSEITSDATLKYLTDNNLFVSVPSKTTSLDFGDEKRPMTADEYYEYVKRSGPQIKDRISQAMEYIQSLPDDEVRQDYIDSIVDDVRKQVKLEITYEALDNK